MMAPTEVLAVQHFETISGYIEKYGIAFRPVLLTGSMTAKEKREAYAKIASGEANLIIGTHALIQEKVEYSSLALVVTDEQHRFGVRQRETLAAKGSEPHVLVMSATPIPRTLAIILYGDLKVSVIDELPANRLPIKNCVVGTSYRPKAYEFIAKEVAAGRQAYVICPMVEEGESEDLENVVDYTEKLRAVLPPSVQVAYLHGKMRPADKNRIMEEFAAKEIDVLVSTTVIEVGINVPNATVMMVENAERSVWHSASAAWACGTWGIPKLLHFYQHFRSQRDHGTITDPEPFQRRFPYCFRGSETARSGRYLRHPAER